MSFHHTPTELLSWTAPNVREDVKHPEFPFMAAEYVTWYDHFGILLDGLFLFYFKFNIYLSNYSANLPVVISQREMKAYVHKKKKKKKNLSGCSQKPES